MEFIHYGTKYISKDFKYDKSNSRRTLESGRNKPIGLWASPIGKNFYTWKDFCIDDEWNLESLKCGHVKFSINAESKLLYITNERQLRWAFNKYGYIKQGCKYFNWKKIESLYDGVFVQISNLPKSLEKDLVWEYNLYSWDVDSLVLFNLDKIVFRKKLSR